MRGSQRDFRGDEENPYEMEKHLRVCGLPLRFPVQVRNLSHGTQGCHDFPQEMFCSVQEA